MKKPEKGKKKKIIGYNYLGMVGIAVIALVLLGSLMVQSKGLQQRLDYYNSKAAALDKSIDSEKERTKEIEAQKEYMKTDELIFRKKKNHRMYGSVHGGSTNLTSNTPFGVVI